MKCAAKLLFTVVIALLFVSCFEPEEFSNVPAIEFESLDFIDTEGIDSLILSFSFEDGGGDLGLNNAINDLVFPYHIYSWIIDANDSLVSISDPSIELPLYKIPILVEVGPNGQTTFFFDHSLREIFSETDNRPSYDCENYEFLGTDTIFVARNEFHNNFHVQFFEKFNGSYSEIDFGTIFGSDDCDLGNFNGRIPVFDPNGKEGVITYSMLSQLFRLSFQDDTIQLRFWGAGYSPEPATDCGVKPDPLASLSPPPFGSCDHTEKVVVEGGETETLSPGRYCAGLEISSDGTANFEPGTYIIEGDKFTVNAGARHIFRRSACPGKRLTTHSQNRPPGTGNPSRRFHLTIV